MIEIELTIKNRSGLHTRPAAALVKTAARFQCEFYLKKDDFEINGKSIIGVMTLAAEQGATLVLTFDGADEQLAADTIKALFEDGFGEL